MTDPQGTVDLSIESLVSSYGLALALDVYCERKDLVSFLTSANDLSLDRWVQAARQVHEKDVQVLITTCVIPRLRCTSQELVDYLLHDELALAEPQMSEAIIQRLAVIPLMAQELTVFVCDAIEIQRVMNDETPDDKRAFFRRVMRTLESCAAFVRGTWGDLLVLHDFFDASSNAAIALRGKLRVCADTLMSRVRVLEMCTACVREPQNSLTREENQILGDIDAMDVPFDILASVYERVEFGDTPAGGKLLGLLREGMRACLPSEPTSSS